MQKASALAVAHIVEPSSVWGIGAYGALAEFRRDEDEPLLAEDFKGLKVATARGAIRLELNPTPEIIAYETISAKCGHWLHGIAFTLPAQQSPTAKRTVLTELGEDADAILGNDRGGIVFDLGLGTANVDACIRTNDPELLFQLRRCVGEPLLGGSGRAMEAIKEAHPHRMFASALGRIEVFAPIGSTRHNQHTPEGPHTHVLPKLLTAGRTHPATIDLGASLPALWLYPASPTHDIRGHTRPFDEHHHQVFQEILSTHGRSDYVDEKNRALKALAASVLPVAYDPPKTKLGRVALRVALRQVRAREGETALLGSWRDAFDPTSENLTPKIP